MIQTKPLLIAGLAALLALGGAATAAFAFPDAKVDAEMRPNFRDLIYPPIRHHERFHYEGRYGYRPLHPEYYSRGVAGGSLDITVDCSGGRSQALSDALYYLAPGGALHVRAGSACTDSLYIDKSVVIVGEADSAFAEDSMRRPRIEATPGAPCISVAPHVRLELRDIALVNEQAGRNGCIEGEDADIALSGVSLRYAGGRSAIDVSGGRLIVRDSQIDARQADSAILGDDTAVQISKSEIRSQLMGLDLTPALNAPSTITDVRLIGPGNGEEIEPRTVGVMVRGGQRASGQLTIRGTFIGHWRTGLWLDAGSRVDILSSRIHKAALGILIDEAEGDVRDSAIGASQVGVYAGSGKLVLDHNRIYGFRQAPVVLDRAVISAEREDLAYPDGGGCGRVRDWAPRCMSLEYLPYDLTVEDPASDWGAHGPIIRERYDQGFGPGPERPRPAPLFGLFGRRPDPRKAEVRDARRDDAYAAERHFDAQTAAASGATIRAPPPGP